MVDLDSVNINDLIKFINFYVNKRKKNNLDDTKKQNNSDSSEVWKVGKSYFIRTVTMHTTGRLKLVTKKELVLTDASWIADSGRFHDALKKGELNEVEPFVNDVIINRDAIVDATIWDHKLPIHQK